MAKNQYFEDLSGNEYYKLRAYAHDVVQSMEDPSSDVFVDDVTDLLSLISGILESEGIRPDEYADTLGRGGEEKDTD